MLPLIIVLILTAIGALAFGSLVAIVVGRKKLKEWAADRTTGNSGTAEFVLGWVGVALVISASAVFIALTVELGRIL